MLKRTCIRPLVMRPSSTLAEASISGTAASIIMAGTPFEDLARQHSQDRGSGPAGGDIGFFSRGELVQPFEDAVLALEPGEVSEADGAGIRSLGRAR